MLLVQTYLDRSPIHGIGLFAGEFIPKGTVIWSFTPGLDLKLRPGRVERLPEPARAWVLHYGYYLADEKRWVVCVDDARFFNHSADPNTRNTRTTVALRDIEKGEELTSDYHEFDGRDRMGAERPA